MTWEEYYDFSVDFIKWYRSSGITMTTAIWQSVLLRGKDHICNIQPVKASRCTYCDRDPLCPSMLKKLSVLANGEIIPCAPLAGFFASKDIHMGNVKQEGLRKLLSEGTLFETVTTQCIFFKKGYYRKYSEALSSWKNLVPLPEEEMLLLSGTTGL